MWITIGIIIGVYLVLSAFNASWNTVVVSPARIDGESQGLIAELEQTLARTKNDPIKTERFDLVAGKIANLSVQGRGTLKAVLMHGEVHIFRLATVGINSFDYLQECLNNLLIMEKKVGEGGHQNRVFFINPEFKSAVESYFKKINV
jgi:hypothetical protein